MLREVEGEASVFAGPAPNWASMPTSAHFVQFYEREDVLLDAVSGYFGAGLSQGEAAVIIATPEHLAGVQRRLRARGLDAGLNSDHGQFVWLDAAETLSRVMLDGSPDADRFKRVVGATIQRFGREGQHVRAFGEMVALLVADGNQQAALRLEELWNELRTTTGGFSLFCAYPLRGLAKEVFVDTMREVCAEHSQVIPAESYTDLDTPVERMRAIAVLQQKARALEREVEERKRIEDQLRVSLALEQSAREELNAALQLRDEFLSIASHELRTPLAALNAQTQLILRRAEKSRDLDPERVIRALQVISSQGDKLGRLLGQLLDISRLDSGKLVLEPAIIELPPLVADIVDTARSCRQSHTFTLDQPVSLRVRLDSLRFEQVLVNLLDNAVKYSPAGGQIHVSVRPVDSDWVELSVRDHGLGIPQEKRRAIFDRYFQAHADGYRSGMGLGLYISRQIVQLHGGSIWAEFPVEGGTRMVVRLPARNAG